MGGDDGRPSLGLLLRARDPALDARSRQWQGGRRRQREEAGGWSGRRWGGGGGVVGGDDGRPSRGLVLRARDPALDARSRRWRGG